MRSKPLATLALTLALLAAGCGAPKAAPPQPAPQPAPVPQESPAPAPATTALPGKGFQPMSVAFWDASHGLLAGTAGCPDHCQGLVAVTQDGGKSWQVAYQGGTRAGSTAAAAGGGGWATVSVCDANEQCKSSLLRTADSGKSWRLSPQAVQALSFADASTGWGMTGGKMEPQLVATGDGGLSWQPLASPCAGKYGAEGYPVRVSAGKGWVACAGQPGAGQQPKTVFTTIDGGKTWQEAGTPGWGGYLQGFAMLADGHGWLWERRGNLTATSDGGQTWVDIGLTQPEEVEAISAWLVSERVGFVLLQDNGHRTWILVQTGDHPAPVHSWPVD